MKNVFVKQHAELQSVDFHYTVNVAVGKKTIEYSVWAEFSPDENVKEPDTVWRRDITANPMEALPYGYDQQEVSQHVQEDAMAWIPVKVTYQPLIIAKTD